MNKKGVLGGVVWSAWGTFSTTFMLRKGGSIFCILKVLSLERSAVLARGPGLKMVYSYDK